MIVYVESYVLCGYRCFFRGLRQPTYNGSFDDLLEADDLARQPSGICVQVWVKICKVMSRMDVKIWWMWRLHNNMIIIWWLFIIHICTFWIILNPWPETTQKPPPWFLYIFSKVVVNWVAGTLPATGGEFGARPCQATGFWRPRESERRNRHGRKTRKKIHGRMNGCWFLVGYLSGNYMEITHLESRYGCLYYLDYLM